MRSEDANKSLLSGEVIFGGRPDEGLEQVQRSIFCSLSVMDPLSQWLCSLSLCGPLPSTGMPTFCRFVGLLSLRF